MKARARKGVTSGIHRHTADSYIAAERNGSCRTAKDCGGRTVGPGAIGPARCGGFPVGGDAVDPCAVTATCIRLGIGTIPVKLCTDREGGECEGHQHGKGKFLKKIYMGERRIFHGGEARGRGLFWRGEFD